MERTKQSISMRKRWAGRAQQGASMPLALLLFLICAVLASIVLAAATTAGGQATTLKKSEQSYFAVTSAAKLLREQLDGQTIVITTTTTTTPASGSPTTDVKIGDELRRDDSISAINYTLLERITADVHNLNVQGCNLNQDGYDLQSTYENDVLKVHLKISPGSNGKIKLNLSQAAAKSNSNNKPEYGYELNLILTPDEDSYTEVTDGANGSTISTTETRVTWWVDEIQVKGGASS